MQTNSAATVHAARAFTRASGKVSLVSLVVVLLVIAGLAGLAWYLGQRNSNGQRGPGGMGMGFGGGGFATTVGVAQTGTQDIPVVLEALGTVTPIATVTVRPQVSGVITEIRFTEGQLVTKGQVLAVIDRRPFQMALEQAEGALQRDEAQLQNARLQLERYRTLLSQDSIAEQEVDAQAATVKQLDGTVAADRAAVGTARLNLDFSEVKSPVAGRVGLRVIDVGNYIGAGDASGIVVVTQIAPTDVAFTVPQDRANEIFEPVGRGEKLAATALDRTRTNTLAQGEFLTLDNVVNTDTGTVRAKARFQNTENTLFPSQFVNLRLTLRTIKDAVVVPASAVRNGSNGDFVWLINEDKTVTQRNIKRGQVTTDQVQVLEGLKPGDQIVTEGGDRLKEGAQVTLPGDKPRQFTPGERPQGQGQNGERRRRRNNGEGGPPGGGPGGGAGGPPPGAP